MKMDLKKLETAFPRWSASKFPFFAVACLSELFIHFLNTASCHWLSVIKLNGKLNPRLSWVLETSSLDRFTANKIILSRVENRKIRHSLSLSIKAEKKSSKQR